MKMTVFKAILHGLGGLPAYMRGAVEVINEDI